MRDPRNYENPLCAQVGTDLFYPEDLDEDQRTNLQLARKICSQCTHIIECAEWGISNEKHGIWGGLTSFERRQIRLKRGIKVRQEDIA